jgi:hypothetical protein
MQFRPPPPSQVRDVRPAQQSPPIDREYPLDTAGDRCLWHVGGTADENDEARTWRWRLPAQPEGEGSPGCPSPRGQAANAARQPGAGSRVEVGEVGKAVGGLAQCLIEMLWISEHRHDQRLDQGEAMSLLGPVGLEGGRQGTVQSAQNTMMACSSTMGGCPFTVIAPPLGLGIGGGTAP